MFFVYTNGVSLVKMKYVKGSTMKLCTNCASIGLCVKMYHPYRMITVSMSSIFKIHAASIKIRAIGDIL
jgi:hypothetical protein